jgi:tRNA threonylcarbamoyladenosine biosynthesis protein TsaE
MIRKTKSVRKTQKLAADLARKIAKSKPQKHACVLALEGELGAGKTTFIQGFARALKIKQRITSPTFVLMRHYKLRTINPEKASGVKPRGGHATLRGPRGFTGYKLLVHIDAFRLKDWRELIPLGAKEMLASPENIVLIEWAERVRPILPRKHIKIHIDHLDRTTRRILIK